MINKLIRIKSLLLVSGVIFLLACILSDFYLVKVFSIIVMFFLPGFYSLLAMRQKNKSYDFGLSSFLFSVGLSIVILYISSLAVNITGRSLDLTNTLARPHLLICYVMLTTILFIVAWFRSKNEIISFRFKKSGLWNALLLGSTCMILTVIGAIRLNNGANASITIFTLIIISLSIGAITYKAINNVYDYLPLIVYFFGLSVLLMVSLRGHYVTGHDIQSEYYVFQLTQKHSLWNLSFYRDAYNACLSITILPTFISNVFHIDPQLVFKTVFQFVFALVPVIVFKITRKFSSQVAAFVASILFISFPIFINDMTMYNRQEIAFLFFALALLAIYDKAVKPIRIPLFLVFIAAMIVSHYSTAYIAIAILFLVQIIFRITSHHFVIIRTKLDKTPANAVTLRILLITLLLTFLWVAQLTSTSTGPLQLVTSTFKNLNASFNDSLKSGDTNYIFPDFASSHASQSVSFAQYLKDQNKSSTPDKSEYTKATLPDYIPHLTEQYVSPSASLGNDLDKIHVPSELLVSGLRSLQARVLQFFLIVGTIVLWFRWKNKGYNNQEQYAFYLASILVCMLMVVLPFLTYEYSLLRVFQQVLIFAGLPLAVGIIYFGSLFKTGSRIIIALIVTVNFASLSGLLPQLIGGYYPQLNLNNVGLYYDLYYTHRSEAEAFMWLNHQNNLSTVHMDLFSAKKFRALTGISAATNILPTQIAKNELVYIGYSSIKNNTNYVFYKGNWLVYKYPIKFMNENKNLIYSDGGSSYYE